MYAGFYCSAFLAGDHDFRLEGQRKNRVGRLSRRHSPDLPRRSGSIPGEPYPPCKQLDCPAWLTNLAVIVIPQHFSDAGGGLWGLGMATLFIIPAVAIISLLVGIGVWCFYLQGATEKTGRRPTDASDN